MGQILDEGDVVFFRGKIGNSGSRTYQVYELLKAVRGWSESVSGSGFLQELLGSGTSAGCLLENKDGWKEGKIRLRVEFIPDETEPETEEQEATIESTPALPAASPLDDLREELNIK